MEERPRATMVHEILSGSRLADSEMIDVLLAGLPAAAVDGLLSAGLRLDEVVHVLGISKRTARRKLRVGDLLTIAEGDRLVRLARILAEADRCIGNHEKTLHWLRTPNWALGDRVPLDLVVAESGVEMVRQALMTIAYGGVA